MTVFFQHIQEARILSHAYLVRGHVDDATHRLIDGLLKRGIATRGNPDFYSVAFEAMGIDDTRALIEYASLAPLGEHKYIVVATKSATEEAQTALLKVVEEGSGRSIFFFIIEAGAFVLPTLTSRCVVLKVAVDSLQSTAGKEFLELSYKDRLAVAEKFGKDKDREGARVLVRSLLRLADQKKFDAKVLRDLLDADRYLTLSGSSPKGVIGHLALVL